MNIELPLYRQEKDNTCALACLRMVLAAFGTHIEENVLESLVDLRAEGTSIVELERLARRFNLSAEISDIALEDMPGILQGGRFPIAYIDRAVFDLRPANERDIPSGTPSSTPSFPRS